MLRKEGIDYLSIKIFPYVSKMLGDCEETVQIEAV
jgi:hypothetical protein